MIVWYIFDLGVKHSMPYRLDLPTSTTHTTGTPSRPTGLICTTDFIFVINLPILQAFQPAIQPETPQLAQQVVRAPNRSLSF